MDDALLTKLLNEKIEWMGRLYDIAKDLDMYHWVKINGLRHRCDGAVYVYVETTGIGYVCEKCKEAEVL